MGKTKGGLWIIVVIFPFLIAADVQADLRSCLINTAKSQIGVRERTGKNDGVEVRRYLRSVKLKEGCPYCAAFASWCMQQHCIPNVKSGLAADYFKDPKAIVYDRRYPRKTKDIHQGDLGGIYFSNLGGIHHVFFIVKWDDMVTTIEANTSDANYGSATRDGQGVYMKKRLKSQIYQVSKIL